MNTNRSPLARICSFALTTGTRALSLAVAVVAIGVQLRGQANYATPYTFSTLAGKVGVRGFTNGTGDAATFNIPQGVAVDGSGNVYVADNSNQCVRKITSAGVVTTFLNMPASALAVDAAGNLFIADGTVIVKATNAGVVTTISGGTPTESTGVPGGFNGATGIAVDSNGLIYIADASDDVIYTMSQETGVANPLAGFSQQFGHQDGTGSAAHFSNPSGLAVDASGNVFVADSGNYTIRKITPAGVVTTIAGTAGTPGYADGTGSAALLGFLFGIAIDSSGNLYVTGIGSIRKCTSAGVVTTLAGTPSTGGSADGTGAGALFSEPVGLAVDASGDMFVADSLNDTIRARYAAPYGQPTIATQPANESVAIGASATFTVAASGVPVPNYQWLFDGTFVAGGTDATLTVTNVQATNLGSYSVIVSSDAGSVTSNAATLSSPGVTPIPPPVPPVTAGYLSNISTRAFVGTGASIEIAGFVVTGPPGSTEQVLIRAAGVSLGAFLIENYLDQPVLTLFDSSGTQIATNTAWTTNSNSAQIAAAAASVGAFALAQPQIGYYSDAALLLNLSPGTYTAQVSGPGGTTGISLAEVYEVGGAGTAQFSNISTRASVSTGQAVAIGGITVAGTQPMKVLIRAVGPTLANFSVSGVLAVPTLTVVDSKGNTVAMNTGWSTNANAAAIASEATAVGAFALPTGSADCALLLTLNPGSYTAVVSGPSGATGIALVEAYQAP
jgi:sugar lactone lactonase YvrE